MHKKDLVHRDIKGGNLLVTSSGDVLLADFDTATTITPGAKITSFGALGTPFWAAPEIAACDYPSVRCCVHVCVCVCVLCVCA